MTPPERKPTLVMPPDGQDQPGKAVLGRIFDKLEVLQLDGAVNKENLRQIKEQVKDLGGRTQFVESKVTEVAATVKSHTPLFETAADVGMRLGVLERNCAGRAGYPLRVEALERKLETIQVAQAAGAAADAAERSASDQWLDRIWPLAKAVLWVVFAIALYNAKAFLHLGP
jgi:hypothetical protein